MTPLPRLMVAPNGARRGKSDHLALPVSNDEVIATALACQKSGADGIHLHLRDDHGEHLLSAAHYAALLDQLAEKVPGMYLQVTSESAGRYSANQQRNMMRTLLPAHVSVALREMVRSPDDWPEAQKFYHWAAENAVEIQHILYSPQEVSAFVDALLTGKIPQNHHLIQLVQGTYADGDTAAVDLKRYLAAFDRADSHSFDWMLCAFGANETKRLVDAALMGGKARAGFENSLWHVDGSIAKDNAERIREVDAALRTAVPPLKVVNN
ncbi:MAG: 3-keto-5-aminohexanoate cleavage protein [Sulfitobacter sp.]